MNVLSYSELDAIRRVLLQSQHLRFIRHTTIYCEISNTYAEIGNGVAFIVCFQVYLARGDK